MREFIIRHPDGNIRQAIIDKIDNLNKPKGSLGMLEKLALQVCWVEQKLSPTLGHPCHLLFGADHGIEREGVSVSPRDVTWQQMVNFSKGGGGVNMFCRQHGFQLYLVDVGVDHDLSHCPGIIDRKIARGTADFLHEPAMTRSQLGQAIDTGAEMADRCIDEGADIICIGEMGIANTSPSSIWMSLFCDIPLSDCIGAGAGLDSQGIHHKQATLAKAMERFRKEMPDDSEPAAFAAEAIRQFGGFEMAAAIGAMLRTAERSRLILVDGFIMTACALAASRLHPAVTDYMIFGHQGDESGHARMLRQLHARPLLQLGLRLGEGTGALCAFPIVDSAVRMMNEMNNFDNAHITKYF